MDTYTGQVIPCCTPLQVLWLYWREILIEKMGNEVGLDSVAIPGYSDKTYDVFVTSYERYVTEPGYYPRPEEIFTTQQLDEWAKENGYVRFY
jgi:hypothetical protein